VLADVGYASQTGLRTGSRVTLAGQRFTIVGIVRQPPGAGVQLLIPLRKAQLLSGLGSQLSSVAVQADSAADVGVVSREISAALPWAQLTTSAALAAAITGSLASAARLASELGRWVAAASLTAAVTLASLLTLAAVGRRVMEFGTLKAMGWRTGRVVAQVVGESAVAGGCGALTGIVLGLGGAALVSALAPALTATVLPGAGPSGADAAGPATDPGTGPATLVHLHASVTIGTVLVAVVLGIAGGLLAGAIGGWRAARLRPADAMTRVG
jgi:putative ABC transport system permease protein